MSIWLLLMGWLWGSFLSQLADRSPLRGEMRPKEQPTLLRPVRSFCFSCRAPIAWYDNLPVFSYLYLRGACRHCAAAIGRRTLLVELCTPLAFAVLLGFREQLGWQGYVAACLLWSWLLLGGVLLWEKRRLGLLWMFTPLLAGGLLAAFWRMSG